MISRFRIVAMRNGKSKRVGKQYYKTHLAARLTINAYRLMSPSSDFRVEEF